MSQHFSSSAPNPVNIVQQRPPNVALSPVIIVQKRTPNGTLKPADLVQQSPPNSEVPPKSSITIPRRSPIKEDKHQKNKFVNLSPVLYSPKLKNKTFFKDSVSMRQVEPSHAKLLPPAKKAALPKTNCNATKLSPSRHADQHSKSSEQILCDLQLKCDDFLFVTHSVNGKVFSGLLMTDHISRLGFSSK